MVVRVEEIVFIQTNGTRICTGAPSKAHTRQLVKIQHEERLAATSELNPTPFLVTDRCDAGGKGYQAEI
ncbi:MAG TPA: hypothetical protein VER35_02125 [Candidatus Limnocylindrales bacterium]|nr:hypothetical protein [Candidatus Limnocylindrales bacterium]